MSSSAPPHTALGPAESEAEVATDLPAPAQTGAKATTPEPMESDDAVTARKGDSPIAKRQKIVSHLHAQSGPADVQPSTQNRPEGGPAAPAADHRTASPKVSAVDQHDSASAPSTASLRPDLSSKWASVHEVMATEGLILGNLPGAWRALVAVWRAMSAPCTADELLSHMDKLALALYSKASSQGWTRVDFPVGLLMSMVLQSTRNTYVSKFAGRWWQKHAKHAETMDLVNDALCKFADTLEVLGSSQDMSEVLKNCQKLNPEMWECFGPSLRSEVLTLGKDQARRGGLFSAKAWCSVTKMIVILDTFRDVATPTERASSGSELKSWHQLITVIQTTGTSVFELFQPDLLGGEDSPVHLSCVEPDTHKRVAFWLIFTRLRKDLLADHDVLGQALQALIRPWMQSDFLVAAREKCLFDYSLRMANPIRYAKLVATLFKSVGLGQPGFAAEARDPAVQLMLCLLCNMKDMGMRWQRDNLETVFRNMMQLLPSIMALLTEALEQATFALPQALAAALVTCSVPLPRPLTHLAAVFDQYGLALAAALAQKPQATQAPHVFGQQILLESACKGLELREALPHFADSSNRAWRAALRAPVSPSQVASWMLLMLQWVSTFIQRCSVLQHGTLDVESAAAIFAAHLKGMLPEGPMLSDVMRDLSGSACAARLQGCHSSSAGRGFATAFFRQLADSVTLKQRTTFCKSMLDAWEAAQYQPAPSVKDKIPFLRGNTKLQEEGSTCVMCLCLMAFGPGATQQESILDQCIAVAQNPALFNLYSTAAIMIPEHAEELMDIDAAVSGFLTAVSQVLSSLTWLNNQANLSTGSILQLSHLAAALPTMDGCSDILVTVKLIDMRHQLDQCRLFLKFLGSDSAMRLDPAAQVAHELQCVVALKEKATGQQMHEVLTRSQELFLSADHTAFVKHFAAHDSALYNAYLQQSWQHQTDLLLQLRGVDGDQDEDDYHEHPLTESAQALPVATVSAAAVLIDRVLDSVHEDLSRLLNDDNLLLRFLDVARHHLAGRDEAAELQVVAEFFYPSGPHGEQAAPAERSMRVLTRQRNIQDAIALTQWGEALPHILTTIEGYGLSRCLDDDFSSMQTLAVGSLAPDTLSSLGFQEAASVLESIRQCCNELSGPEKMLFKSVNACSAFWNFIKQEKFYGIEGSRRFDNQVSLVTGQLMSEVYDAGVLADVQQAQRIIAAFLTAESFKGLMVNVQHLHLDARPSGHADEAGILLPAVACLEAVARNMELILNWFSNNSEQKIQTTSLQLEQLLSSGKFHVKLPASVCQQPSLSCTYTLAETSQNREQHMSSDGLTEFVSKLYLNRHQEHNPAVFDERIDLFLGCYKEVMEIQVVQQQLRAAGHPDHQYTTDDIVYELAHGLQYLQSVSADLCQLFASWQDQIQAVHDKHHLTYFLSTHQLVAASEMLQALLANGDTHEQSQRLRQLLMLVPTLGDVSSATLRATIQAMEASALQGKVSIRHLEAVGHLMQQLSTATPPQMQQQPLGQCVVVAPDQSAPLHRILLTLHAGAVIQPGQILWCSQSTHASDLDRFLKCTEHHSEHRRFSMVGLETLPVQLREKVLNFQIRVSSGQLPVSVDYILASGHEALLGTMSWMQVIRLQEQDILSPAEASVQVHLRHSLRCFCGSAGSGKSHSMAASAAKQPIKPVSLTIGENTNAADIICCLAKAANEHTTNPHIQFFISSYADFDWLNQLFYQLLVEGDVTDPATGAAFGFLAGVTASIEIEVPNAVPGEALQETAPPFAHKYPALSGAMFGMLLHLPVLADLVGNSAEPQTAVVIIDPDKVPADYSNFGPLVFPLLKLYFTPHPFGGNRRLLDTTPSEADAVARHTGMQLYKDGLFFTLDAVQVTPEECSQLMGELQAMVDKVMQESVHPFDRMGPTGSRLRVMSFMRHLHHRAAFFSGGLRDDLYLHFASIVFEIGVRECCQLVNKSLRSDWNAYPHSFLLYHDGDIQVVVSLQDQMDPFCQQHIRPCGGRLQDELRPYMVGGQQQPVTDRLIFTDAPQQYNTVAVREELLAAALLGSASKKLLVHEVLKKHQYILTLDYTMEMLHLEERRQSGVPTIMSSDTGVGKTKLLTVYHELVTARYTAKDSRQEALLGLLQPFVASHNDTLEPVDIVEAADNNAVLAAVLQPELAQPDAPVPSIMDSLKHLRENGTNVSSLHNLACRLVTALTTAGTETSSHALNRVLSAMIDFVESQLTNNKLLDHEQLACILHSLGAQGAHGGVMDRATAASKAYLLDPTAWHAEQHNTQACIDELLLDHLDPTDAVTPQRSESVLLTLAGLLAVSSLSTFQAIQMHAQVTPADMWAKVKPFISLASACPSHHFTFFVDELNTSSMMGEMKTIFIDNTFQGVQLPSNIFWVAAINPAKAEVAPQQADGMQSFSARYAVHACPASMEEVVWAFGNMSAAQEKDYVTAKLQMVATQWTGLLDFSEDTCRLLMRYITTAQASVKEHLEDAAVSQRDLQRVFNLLAFFIQHHKQRGRDLPETVPLNADALVHRSLLLSIAVAYYFRLDRQLRQHFLERMAELDALAMEAQDELVPCYDMAAVVDYELELYIQAAELPQGIAPNQALRENFFCIAVCVETKTPLIIIGTPGNSKTLSFKVAADRLRGSSSSSKLFRLFHAVDLFHYQCSEQSTSQEIGTVCARALERQRRHTQLQQRSIATVLLDEGGLPGDEKEALKIVHYLWDNAELAYVTISNRPLDAAKSNRAVNVYRSEPSQQDLETLASSFLTFNLTANTNTQQAQCIKACCMAYAELTSNPDLNFGRRSGSSRDLHHFFKYLARQHRHGDRVDISTATVVEALQRNFGGLPSSDFHQVVPAFLEQLRKACGPHKFPNPKPEDFKPTLEVLTASLDETGHSYIEQHAALSDKSARPKLIIDYTGDDSAYRLLFSSYHADKPVLDRHRTKVFQMSAFKDDQSPEAQKHMIGDIRRAIECGDTCFLMYTEAIHGSLYDLFNQFFTVQRDKDQNAKLYVQIGIGSYSKPCFVHPEARIVVHTPARLLHTLQAPFLDRFEKYAVSVDSFWELLRAKKDAASCQVLDEVLVKCQELISTLGLSTFYGAIPDSTVTTVLLSILQENVPQDNQLTATVDHKSLVRVLVRAVVTHLLQIMKPHSFLQQAGSGACLPALYVHFYSHRQEHYNLKQLLSAILGTEPLPSLASEVMDAADVVEHTDPAMDEPETSAAAEARAALMHPQLLQSKPPQDKWVIFTSTTPDLDMGYVLPAGGDTGAPEMLQRQTMLRNFVMDHPEALMVHKLEHLTSKAACLAAVESVQTDISIEVAVFTADMRHVSQRQVSMLRLMIDDATNAASTDATKKWVLLLHFMPGAALYDSYPALFLYGWNFWYLDSCTGGMSQHEMLRTESWTAAAAPVFQKNDIAVHHLLGEAEMQYGSNTKPYLLTHLRSTVTAEQAAAQAQASLPASLRPFADFYMSHDHTRRQAALDSLLLQLQGAFQQQYSAMWTPEAICVLMLKAAKSVSDGYHRNLSTALADMYQTHVGSFLAGIIYRLCGNNLDLITLMHAHQDWTASRRADDSFLQSILQFCETRTVAELPALMNQVNVISVLEGADYSSFRPAHEFPLFAQVYASLNNVKDDALLSLELGERSMPETIMNAMEEQLVQDGGLAALQGCVVLDGGLRLRYSKSVARNRLDVPSIWFSQQQHYGTMVVEWLMNLWPDGKLSTLHVQLHLHETQLAAGVMLLEQMAQTGQQQAGQLPISLAQRELSTFIVMVLWNSLQGAAHQEDLQSDTVKPLQQAAQHIHSCSLTASSKRYILLAANKLLDGVNTDSLRSLHRALQALLQFGTQQHASASTTYIEVIQLLRTFSMRKAAAQAVECLVLDLVRRMGKAHDAQADLKNELLAALHAVFTSGLPISKHMQEYILIELLSPHTLQPANRAKRAGVRAVLQHFAEGHLEKEVLPVLLRVQEAELTYVPGIYADIRTQAANAASPFADALYTAQLRLCLAAKMPIAGAAQDLPSLLADLRRGQPSSTSPPSKQLMDSITYCVQLHSTIAWIASELGSAEAEQQLQHALLHSDAAGRLQQQLHTIFTETTHQRLFVSYLLQYSTDKVLDVLDRPSCVVGLGAWTEAWANAMRPHEDHHAAQQPQVCSTEDYVALQRHFQATIIAHASEAPQRPSNEAVSGAQQWQLVVEEAANTANGAAKRRLKCSIVLMTYYGLFDMQRYSAALDDVCPRLAAVLNMTPKEEFVLHFLANLSSQQLDHVHADTDMAHTFDRATEDLSAETRSQRHFLVNLLAYIMQQPPNSSILSTHLFTPGKVHGSFPLGSTYGHPVGQVHYDCGVQFTEDHDMVGAQPPLQDAASAHFVTLLSWGALSLGHMLFSDVHATIYGPVMSHRGIDPRIAAATDHAWLSTFMLMRVESCWRGLQLKAGLSGDLRMLVLNGGLHNLLNTLPAEQADRQTFSSRQECVALETALRDVFYTAYNSRQEMQTELEAMQTASQLRQEFQHWNRDLPWTMHVPGLDMAHAQQPSLLDMLPLYIASDRERAQAHGLLSAFLAQQSDWEVLKGIRPALQIYSWAHTALRGLVTLDQTLNSSLYEYIQAFRRKDPAELWWNKFHTLKGGFVADDCQPNSKFSVLTDETPLAIFLGFKSEDNELVKVLKALMMLQNDFLEKAQEYDLPQRVSKMPVHLLTHSSMDQYLLQSRPFHFDSYVYSQVVTDTAPVEFDLLRLTHQVAQNVASKRFITNTMLGLHKDFCYKQSEAQDTADGHTSSPQADLLAAFAVSLSPRQLNTLRTHCTHLQLEELRQVSSILDALGQLSTQQDTSEGLQRLLPAGLIKDAVASLAGDEPLQASLAHSRQTTGFFRKHGVQELQLAHLQPVRDFFLEQYQQQGYQFADISPLLKAPVNFEVEAALKSDLACHCAQDPMNKQALTEMVAALREAELDTLPRQANQGATLRSVCEAWAYEVDEFPLSVLDAKLMCSQYVAVMRIMLQVLRQHQENGLVQPKIWTEVDCDGPPQAAQLIRPGLLRLPIWTDAVSEAEHKLAEPDKPAVATKAAVSLPQSITWQRTPEPMLVKAIRLRLQDKSAVEVLQGMLCGLSISVQPCTHDSGHHHHQAAATKLHLRPDSFHVIDDHTLSAAAELPVQVDQCVSIRTVGEVCGPGDGVYLASWGQPRISQTFTDDASETSYILCHGDAAAGDECLVEVLLHQAQDQAADEPASPVKQDHQSAMDWLQHFAPAPNDDQEMVSALELEGSAHDAVPTQAIAEQPKAYATESMQCSPPLATQARAEQPEAYATEPMQCSPPPTLPEVQLQAQTSVVATLASPEPATMAIDMTADTAAACVLQTAGFQSKAEALAWLGADGYAKAKTALSTLGVTHSSEVALLQAHQLVGLHGVKHITRKKLFLILDQVVSDADRVQIVLARYRSWLRENLEMEAAGDLKFIKRKDLCADLHASPLSNLARDFLTMAAPET